MGSVRQIKWNRRNAAKSTGPRTSVGNANVRLNALKRGLFAQDRLLKNFLLQHESTAGFKRLQARLTEYLAAVRALEELLIERMVPATWRLLRLYRLEKDAYSSPSRPNGRLGGMAFAEAIELQARARRALKRLAFGSGVTSPTPIGCVASYAARATRSRRMQRIAPVIPEARKSDCELLACERGKIGTKDEDLRPWLLQFVGTFASIFALAAPDVLLP